MRSFAVLVLGLALSNVGCGTAETGAVAENDVTGESELSQATARSYAGAAGWGSTCAGESLTQSRLEAQLGDAESVVLGRFRVALRDVCSPWVNGTSSCGPSMETAEAVSGAASYAFGLAPVDQPRYAGWQLAEPLLVQDAGNVVARRVGDRVVVQLEGDLSKGRLAKSRSLRGELGSFQDLYGRLVSGDLVRDGVAGAAAPPYFRSQLLVAAADTQEALALDAIDVETFRHTVPPAPLSGVGQLKTAYGRTTWSEPSSRSIQGAVTASCLHLTDGLKPSSIAITATFDAAAN